MRMYRYIVFAIAAGIIGACTGNERQTVDGSARLNAIFDDYKEYTMRTFPEWATYEGDHRFNDRLTDHSDAAARAGFDSLRTFLSRLNAIDTAGLSANDRLNYSLFERELQSQLGREKLHDHYMPLTQQNGIHIGFPQLIETQPLASADDYQRYFARLRGFDKQVSDVIDNMRRGIAADLALPAFLAEQILTQITNIKDAPTADTPFMLPAKTMDTSIAETDRDKLRAELADIVENSIKPAYERLYTFVADEYLPACRSDAGYWSLPEGDNRYLHAVRHHTTTDLTPEEIFNIGQDEVKRIRNAMNAIKDSLGFQGSMAEFFEFLRTDPQFYYTEKEPMMEDYRSILKRMDAQLPQLFGRLPQAAYDLKEMELYRAKSAPQAYYYSAPEDRSRPGYFYVNTYDLGSRPRYTMTALALHEAVPGHHLQISLAQETEGLPWFRQNMSVTAYVEGWGLYSESLGYETGMYDDLYQRFGALTFEMWRACRLVVDAGMHYKRWTREQAVEFMMENTANSELDIRSEIDRYIAWPGQALAYKIGELKIKALRAEAQASLGDAFDIREFHDITLASGAIPLAQLEKNIRAWVAQKSSSS